MICIFCKQDSSTSRSVEHIIPESLGNTKNILPKGVVCDKCNSYFGRKVEQPVLAITFFHQLRARNIIETKKKKVPDWNIEVYHPEVKSDEHQAIIFRPKHGLPIFSLDWDFAQKIVSGRTSRIIVDDLTSRIELPKRDPFVSKFIAKMAVEILAQMVIENGWPMETITHDERIDSIRNYARYGIRNIHWEYFLRKAYGENDQFFYDYEPDKPVDVLYQYDRFFIGEEMFFCIIIKGYEFTINIGDPSISKYVRWLLQNQSKSPIQIERTIRTSSPLSFIYI